MKTLVVVSLSVCLLASCGKKEKFSYDFTENECKTGEHKADSKDDHCSNLKNNSLNNGCAEKLRKDEYERQGCGSW